MELYNARVEMATRDTSEKAVDELIDQLLHYHPAASKSDRGWLEVIITFPAENLVQATLTALAVVQQAADRPAVAIEVMRTAEFDGRLGFVALPPLVGVAQAANILGVSRQRILQMIDEGKLMGTKVGNSMAIPTSALEGLAGRQTRVRSLLGAHRPVE